MVRTVWVYSEQELSPRAADVIREIKNNAGYEDVRFKFAEDIISGGKILVFGSKAPEGHWEGVEFIHTYSVAQLVTKANAVTVLTASLKLYFGEKHVPPREATPTMVLGVLTPEQMMFDPTLPTVIDIETDGNLGKTHTPDEVRLISIGMYQEGRAPHVWVIPDLETHGTKPYGQNMLDMFAEELPKFEKAIYHNGKFDTRVLNRELGVTLKVWFDTMLAHHVLNHAAKMHGLKELAMRYLGAPDWEGDIKSFLKGGGHYERIYCGKLVEYNGWDVYWTYQLYLLLQPQIEADENNQMAFEFEMAIADMLLEVERNGIPFSSQNAAQLSGIMAEDMAAFKQKLAELTGKDDFNPNSPQQVRAWLDANYNTVPGTSEAILTEIMEDEYTPRGVKLFCDLVLEYRGASKVKGTYAEGWMKHERNGLVHPTFLVHGTSTGRLSSTGPNAQNVPRDKTIRKIVTLEN